MDCCVLAALAVVPITRCPHGGPVEMIASIDLLFIAFDKFFFVSTIPIIPACALHSLKIEKKRKEKEELVFSIHNYHDS